MFPFFHSWKTLKSPLNSVQTPSRDEIEGKKLIISSQPPPLTGGGLRGALSCAATLPDTSYTDFVFGYNCMKEVEKYLKTQGEKYAGGS